MSTKFYNLQVEDVHSETEDSVVVSFSVPTELQSEFQYTPGQYLTLETEIGGEDVRRSYSLCSAPHEKEWKVAIKQVTDGKFSTFANQKLKAGDQVNVMAPTGNFKLVTHAENQNHYVAFAAGSGITPIMSMIKSVLNEEANSTFTLFYGNRQLDSIIFREELEALKNQFLNRLSLHHILSKEKLGSPLFFGRIDGEKCKKFGAVFFDPAKVHSFYLCGPSQMIFAIQDELKNLGVDGSKIHFELFTTSDIKIEKKEEEASFDPSTESKVTIILDEESFDMPLKYGGLSVLDAALAAGADLPYACKGGVCSTCKAKIMEGEVVMDLNYALEPDELEKGYVLTCQSHPRTAEVTVNFDEA
ncbi:MAG: phenylacetate-CoA oxygenase/reductase subunit PaaK [Saprospiraceae bacterium]|nr:phenylacetate-CoA oxygenase/reductase subunit PaaK [Saprospiraceae bacterium]